MLQLQSIQLNIGQKKIAEWNGDPREVPITTYEIPTPKIGDEIVVKQDFETESWFEAITLDRDKVAQVLADQLRPHGYPEDAIEVVYSKVKKKGGFFSKSFTAEVKYRFKTHITEKIGALPLWAVAVIVCVAISLVLLGIALVLKYGAAFFKAGGEAAEFFVIALGLLVLAIVLKIVVNVIRGVLPSKG